ncbi:bifunctional diaminohydroxyphosphoribosylaminopyrimidine deaminase/5-amino-6-(5-phosphoribosylamino)uracil reductase RibD [Eionea flava]
MMSFSASDYRFMARALQLAEKGRYTARPNPCVGCVLVQNDQVVAEGWHYRAGEAHAEVNALQQLLTAEMSAQRLAGNITAYVTLEPCAHQGRTGACAKALARNEYGITRVVYGMEDPNPLVAGKGLEILRAAQRIVDGPLLPQQCEAINRGFVSRMRCSRPWVTAKIATSMDGRTAMRSGESQWITGAAARRDVQQLRAKSCAIVTGVGSILQDNSRLTVRADQAKLPNMDDILARPPLRVVLDSSLQLAENDHSQAAIFDGVENPKHTIADVIIFTADTVSDAKKQRLLARHPSGVVIESVAVCDKGVDVEQVLSILASRYACNDVLLETGATLLGSCLVAGLVDELVVYQAPIVMGSDARPMAEWPLQTMSDKQALTIIDQRMIGDDVRFTFSVTTRPDSC